MRFIPALALLLLVASPVRSQVPSLPQPDSVFLEDLTWMEVRDAIAAGKTTVIIPTGGTEQNGPHMALGKHNYLVRFKAREIARRLGNALVAPVVAGDADRGRSEVDSGTANEPPPVVFTAAAKVN